MSIAFPTIAWANGTNIYEVNVRQYTREGTLNAFAKHIPRLHDMGVDILNIQENPEKNIQGNPEKNIQENTEENIHENTVERIQGNRDPNTVESFKKNIRVKDEQSTHENMEEKIIILKRQVTFTFTPGQYLVLHHSSLHH